MPRPKSVLVLAVGLGLALALPVAADAQSKAERIALGKAIFQQDCALCHDDSEHMLNDNGPALFGVVGRKVASVDGYTYSPALQKGRDRKDHWSSGRLDKFLSGPEAMYPGTGMPMNFDSKGMRRAVIAYLKTLKSKD